jgi:broad specificity phosphatase PhoE
MIATPKEPVRTLLFIRHAESRIDPGSPPHEWTLTDEGRDGAARIAPMLERFTPGRLLVSPEPKAVQTARVLSARLELDPECLDGLREQDRTGVPLFGTQGEFERYVAEVLSSPTARLLGPESAEEADQRFSAQLDDALCRYPENCLAFVSHGTVMSLFVGRSAGIEPYDLWRRLGMPSYLALSWPEGRLIEALFEPAGVIATDGWSPGEGECERERSR